MGHYTWLEAQYNGAQGITVHEVKRPVDDTALTGLDPKVFTSRPLFDAIIACAKESGYVFHSALKCSPAKKPDISMIVDLAKHSVIFPFSADNEASRSRIRQLITAINKRPIFECNPTDATWDQDLNWQQLRISLNAFLDCSAERTPLLAPDVDPLPTLRSQQADLVRRMTRPQGHADIVMEARTADAQKKDACCVLL